MRMPNDMDKHISAAIKITDFFGVFVKQLPCTMKSAKTRQRAAFILFGWSTLDLL